jgi:hypothetical protein
MSHMLLLSCSSAEECHSTKCHSAECCGEKKTISEKAILAFHQAKAMHHFFLIDGVRTLNTDLGLYHKTYYSRNLWIYVIS